MSKIASWSWTLIIKNTVSNSCNDHSLQSNTAHRGFKLVATGERKILKLNINVISNDLTVHTFNLYYQESWL